MILVNNYFQGRDFTIEIKFLNDDNAPVIDLSVLKHWVYSIGWVLIANKVLNFNG